MSVEHPKGYTGKCNPEVWDERAKPPQPTVKKVGQITEEQVDTYFRDGVVLIEDYFDVDTELEPIKKDIENMVTQIAELLFKEGKIKSKYEEFGFFQRLTMINNEYPGANILVHKRGYLPRSIQRLWSGEKLCNAMEQLIGPDIGGHPVWNLRPKTPRSHAATVPWHQDCAYLDEASYDTHQPTAWIPLLDANEENGCMEFAVGGHRMGKIGIHNCCSDDSWYVMMDSEEMKDNLGVNVDKDLKLFPVKFGSMLLFNNCIPHRSLNNLTPSPGVIRWSLDLRWQDPARDYGFHGISSGIVFRKSEDPDWRPQEKDWNEFLKIDPENPPDENTDIMSSIDTSDTIIVGPWMERWHVTHPTRHSDARTEGVTIKYHSY